MADPPRKQARSSGKWFAAKRYGYGAGLPIVWQGWVALTMFLSVTLGTTFGMLFLRPDKPLLVLSVVTLINVIAVAFFLWICKSRTEGGWRWRWGDKD